MKKKVKCKQRLNVRNKKIDTFNWTQKKEETTKELAKYIRKIM